MTYSATAPVKLLAGTAAAPGVTFTSDTDTGLFSPGANQVAVTTGGVQRLLVGADGSITPSGSLLFPLGSATSPSIAFTGDTDTGLYSPGANQVAIATAGTGRLFVDASGNIGIGAAPSSWASNKSLQIQSGSLSNFSNTLTNNQTFVTNNAYFNSGWKYIYGDVASMYAQLHQGGHAWYNASLGSSGNAISFSEAMRITSTGNVGIGTTTPGGALDVSSSSTSVLRLSNTSNQSDGAFPHRIEFWTNDSDAPNLIGARIDSQYIYSNSNYVRLRYGASEHVFATANGGGIFTDRVIVDTTATTSTLPVVHPLGAVGTPSITFTGDLNTGMWSPAADTLAASTNGTERLRVTSTGNVGIGTTTPTGLFTVAASAPTIDWTFAGNTAFKHSIESTGYATSPVSGNHLAIKVASGSGTQATVMHLNGAGQVGIGTTTPSETLHVNGNARASHFLSQGYFAGQGNLSTADARSGFTGIGPASDASPRDFMGAYSYFYGATHNTRAGEIEFGTGTNTAGSIQFRINATERVRIDSSGRLLVGTSAARSNFFNSTFSTDFQIERAGDCSISAVRNSANQEGPYIILGKTRGTSVGANNSVLDGDDLGYIVFQGSDGTELVSGAAILAEVDGNPGANDMPGRLIFSTTADGAATPTERLRIDSTGQIEAGSLGTAAAPVWSFLSDPNTGIYSPAADTLAFTGGGVEAMRIDSSGRLSVGTTTATLGGNPFRFAVAGTKTYSELIPRDGFAVADNTATAQGVGGSIALLGIYDGSGNYTAFGGIEGQKENGTSGNYAGALVFKSRASFGFLNEAVRITSTGQVRLAGAGITFNGDTATANELDDYEEGVWTPVLRGSTTAGTYELSRAIGIYTKVGRQVTLTMAIQLAGTITGGGAGYAQLTGLPFPQAANSFPTGICLLYGIDIATNYTTVYFTPITGASTSTWFFEQMGDNIAPISLPIDAFSVNDQAFVTVSYIV